MQFYLVFFLYENVWIQLINFEQNTRRSVGFASYALIQPYWWFCSTAAHFKSVFGVDISRENKVIRHLPVSKTIKLNHLLMDPTLGTPSQLLRPRRQLGGDFVGPKLLKPFSLQPLPEGTLAILTCADACSLNRRTKSTRCRASPPTWRN